MFRSSDGVPLGCRCVRLPPYTQLRRSKTRVGLWVRIVSPQFLILATYLTLRRTKKYSVVLGVSKAVWGSDGVPLGCRCVILPP